jgi:hypothetical protein
VGSDPALLRCLLDVRFAPEGGLKSDIVTRRLSAISCREQPQQSCVAYSITSSAVICMISGTVRPSAFAVLRLIMDAGVLRHAGSGWIGLTHSFFHPQAGAKKHHQKCE